MSVSLLYFDDEDKICFNHDVTVLPSIRPIVIVYIIYNFILLLPLLLLFSNSFVVAKRLLIKFVVRTGVKCNFDLNKIHVYACM